MTINKLDPVLLYLVAALVGGMANTITFTTSIIYRVETVGLDPLQLVLVGTTLEATVFLFEIPTGVVADIYSRRLSTIIGFFIMGVGFMMEGLAPVFALVLLSQVIWGLGWTFVSGANTAWLTDEVGAKKAAPVFLRERQFLMLGNLIGIPISLWLAQQYLGLPFLVGGSLRILLAVFLVLFMPETGFQRKSPDEREGWQDLWITLRAAFSHVRQSTILIIFVLIALVVGLYSEGWDRLSEAHLLAQFAFPNLLGLDTIGWFGIFRFLGIVLGLGASEITLRVIKTEKGRSFARLLQMLYAGMLIAMIVFTFSRNFFQAVIFMLFFDAFRLVTFPLTQAWLNQQIKSEVRATVLSMTAQLDAFGQMMGGPIIGWIGSMRSLQAALVTSALALVPSVPLWGWVLRQSEKK